MLGPGRNSREYGSVELILATSKSKVKLLPTGFTLDYYHTHFMGLEKRSTPRIAHVSGIPSVGSPRQRPLKTLSPRCSAMRPFDAPYSRPVCCPSQCPAPTLSPQMLSVLHAFLNLTHPSKSGSHRFALESPSGALPAEVASVFLIILLVTWSQHSTVHMHNYLLHLLV